MKDKQKQMNKGFTLIEIMVSVAIFAIIMTTGIGALVSITNSYAQSQKNKQVNDALNYALETMTRELRLGYNYYSPNNNTTQITGSSNGVQSGKANKVGFESAESSRGYIVFRLGNDGVLYRDTFGGIAPGSSNLTNPDEIQIISTTFTVIGALPPSYNAGVGDVQQPLVWIQIKAKSPGADDTTATSIQTLVSQRVLDA